METSEFSFAHFDHGNLNGQNSKKPAQPVVLRLQLQAILTGASADPMWEVGRGCANCAKTPVGAVPTEVLAQTAQLAHASAGIKRLPV